MVVVEKPEEFLFLFVLPFYGKALIAVEGTCRAAS
jgi:hypothetical protein